jgi:pimeloyl-ACP methyl ester carboxylesterase
MANYRESLMRCIFVSVGLLFAGAPTKWHRRLWMATFCLAFGLFIAKPTMADVFPYSAGVGQLSAAGGFLIVFDSVKLVSVSGDLGYLPSLALQGVCQFDDTLSGLPQGEGAFEVEFTTRYFTPGPHTITFTWVSCDGGGGGGSLTVTIVVPPPVNGGGGGGGGTNPQIPSCSAAMLLDPVPNLLSGSTVISNWGSFSENNTRVVQGIAADGVTELVIEIAANNVGDQCQVTLLNDQPTPVQSSSPDQDGALGNPGDTSFSQSQITVTAVETQSGPLAFAVYRSPVDFARLVAGGSPGESASYLSGMCAGATSSDDQLACRAVSIQVQSTAGGSSSTIPVTILRPPVVLVHGLWDDATAWNNFSPLVTGPNSVDPRFYIGRADYSYKVTVSASVPIYGATTLKNARANSLGLQFNAPRVLNRVDQWIQNFKFGQNPASVPVAAVQADVIGHSMGGIIARYFATLPYFLNDAQFPSFGQGAIHKLITIDTPHLGSQLAIAVLSPQETGGCMQQLLAGKKKFAFTTATVSGLGTFSGAMADLQGPGVAVDVDNVTSAALKMIAAPGSHQLPTGLIAATYTNFAVLNDTISSAWVIRNSSWFGCPADPLAQELTSTGWQAIFNNQPNDAIVPVSSQMDGLTALFNFQGLVHSGGTEDLGFSGPSVMDNGQSNPVPAYVITLLNTPPNTPNYYNLLSP